MIVWPAKDPDEVIEKDVDWSVHPLWRPADSIVSASFTLSTAAGMTVAATDSDTTTSTVTLSGGTDGLKGKVLCQAVTSDGQTLQQTATVLVRAR